MHPLFSYSLTSLFSRQCRLTNHMPWNLHPVAILWVRKSRDHSFKKRKSYFQERKLWKLKYSEVVTWDAICWLVVFSSSVAHPSNSHKTFLHWAGFAWSEGASSSVGQSNRRVAAVTSCKMPAPLAPGGAAQSETQPQKAAKGEGGDDDLCEVYSGNWGSIPENWEFRICVSSGQACMWHNTADGFWVAPVCCYWCSAGVRGWVEKLRPVIKNRMTKKCSGGLSGLHSTTIVPWLP